MVLLVDGRTASDGELLAAAFRARGLGAIVGERTHGSLLGVGEPVVLVDGSMVSLPSEDVALLHRSGNDCGDATAMTAAAAAAASSTAARAAARSASTDFNGLAVATAALSLEEPTQPPDTGEPPVLLSPRTFGGGVDGVPVENLGVAPDVPVANSPLDLETGADAVLEAAVQLLVGNIRAAIGDSD